MQNLKSLYFSNVFKKNRVRSGMDKSVTRQLEYHLSDNQDNSHMFQGVREIRDFREECSVLHETCCSNITGLVSWKNSEIWLSSVHSDIPLLDLKTYSNTSLSSINDTSAAPTDIAHFSLAGASIIDALFYPFTTCKDEASLLPSPFLFCLIKEHPLKLFVFILEHNWIGSNSSEDELSTKLILEKNDPMEEKNNLSSDFFSQQNSPSLGFPVKLIYSTSWLEAPGHSLFQVSKTSFAVVLKNGLLKLFNLTNFMSPSEFFPEVECMDLPGDTKLSPTIKDPTPFLFFEEASADLFLNFTTYETAQNAILLTTEKKAVMKQYVSTFLYGETLPIHSSLSNSLIRTNKAIHSFHLYKEKFLVPIIVLAAEEQSIHIKHKKNFKKNIVIHFTILPDLLNETALITESLTFEINFKLLGKLQQPTEYLKTMINNPLISQTTNTTFKSSSMVPKNSVYPKDYTQHCNLTSVNPYDCIKAISISPLTSEFLMILFQSEHVVIFKRCHSISQHNSFIPDIDDSLIHDSPKYIPIGFLPSGCLHRGRVCASVGITQWADILNDLQIASYLTDKNEYYCYSRNMTVLIDVILCDSHGHSFLFIFKNDVKKALFVLSFYCSKGIEKMIYFPESVIIKGQWYTYSSNHQIVQYCHYVKNDLDDLAHFSKQPNFQLDISFLQWDISRPFIFTTNSFYPLLQWSQMNGYQSLQDNQYPNIDSSLINVPTQYDELMELSQDELKTIWSVSGHQWSSYLYEIHVLQYITDIHFVKNAVYMYDPTPYDHRKCVWLPLNGSPISGCLLRLQYVWDILALRIKSFYVKQPCTKIFEYMRQIEMNLQLVTIYSTFINQLHSEFHSSCILQLNHQSQHTVSVMTLFPWPIFLSRDFEAFCHHLTLATIDYHPNIGLFILKQTDLWNGFIWNFDHLRKIIMLIIQLYPAYYNWNALYNTLMASNSLALMFNSHITLDIVDAFVEKIIHILQWGDSPHTHCYQFISFLLYYLLDPSKMNNTILDHLIDHVSFNRIIILTSEMFCVFKDNNSLDMNNSCIVNFWISPKGCLIRQLCLLRTLCIQFEAFKKKLDGAQQLYLEYLSLNHPLKKNLNQTPIQKPSTICPLFYNFIISHPLKRTHLIMSLLISYYIRPIRHQSFCMPMYEIDSSFFRNIIWDVFIQPFRYINFSFYPLISDTLQRNTDMIFLQQFPLCTSPEDLIHLFDLSHLYLIGTEIQSLTEPASFYFHYVQQLHTQEFKEKLHDIELMTTDDMIVGYVYYVLNCLNYPISALQVVLKPFFVSLHINQDDEFIYLPELLKNTVHQDISGIPIISQESNNCHSTKLWESLSDGRDHDIDSEKNRSFNVLCQLGFVSFNVSHINHMMKNDAENVSFLNVIDSSQLQRLEDHPTESYSKQIFRLSFLPLAIFFEIIFGSSIRIHKSLRIIQSDMYLQQLCIYSMKCITPIQYYPSLAFVESFKKAMNSISTNVETKEKETGITLHNSIYHMKKQLIFNTNEGQLDSYLIPLSLNEMNRVLNGLHIIQTMLLTQHCFTVSSYLKLLVVGSPLHFSLLQQCLSPNKSQHKCCGEIIQTILKCIDAFGMKFNLFLEPLIDFKELLFRTMPFHQFCTILLKQLCSRHFSMMTFSVPLVLDRWYRYSEVNGFLLNGQYFRHLGRCLLKRVYHLLLPAKVLCIDELLFAQSILSFFPMDDPTLQVLLTKRSFDSQQVCIKDAEVIDDTSDQSKKMSYKTSLIVNTLEICIKWITICLQLQPIFNIILQIADKEYHSTSFITEKKIQSCLTIKQYFDHLITHLSIQDHHTPLTSGNLTNEIPERCVLETSKMVISSDYVIESSDSYSECSDISSELPTLVDTYCPGSQKNVVYNRNEAIEYIKTLEKNVEQPAVSNEAEISVLNLFPFSTPYSILKIIQTNNQFLLLSSLFKYCPELSNTLYWNQLHKLFNCLGLDRDHQQHHPEYMFRIQLLRIFSLISCRNILDAVNSFKELYTNVFYVMSNTIEQKKNAQSVYANKSYLSERLSLRFFILLEKCRHTLVKIWISWNQYYNLSHDNHHMTMILNYSTNIAEIVSLTIILRKMSFNYFVQHLKNDVTPHSVSNHINNNCHIFNKCHSDNTTLLNQHDLQNEALFSNNELQQLLYFEVAIWKYHSIRNKEDQEFVDMTSDSYLQKEDRKRLWELLRQRVVETVHLPSHVAAQAARKTLTAISLAASSVFSAQSVRPEPADMLAGLRQQSDTVLESSSHTEDVSNPDNSTRVSPDNSRIDCVQLNNQSISITYTSNNETVHSLTDGYEVNSRTINHPVTNNQNLVIDPVSKASQDTCPVIKRRPDNHIPGTLNRGSTHKRMITDILANPGTDLNQKLRLNNINSITQRYVEPSLLEFDDDNLDVNNWGDGNDISISDTESTLNHRVTQPPKIHLTETIQTKNTLLLVEDLVSEPSGWEEENEAFFFGEELSNMNKIQSSSNISNVLSNTDSHGILSIIPSDPNVSSLYVQKTSDCIPRNVLLCENNALLMKTNDLTEIPRSVVTLPVIDCTTDCTLEQNLINSEYSSPNKRVMLKSIPSPFQMITSSRLANAEENSTSLYSAVQIMDPVVFSPPMKQKNFKRDCSDAETVKKNDSLPFHRIALDFIRNEDIKQNLDISSDKTKQRVPAQMHNNKIVHGWDFNNDISIEESVQSPIHISPLSVSHIEENQNFSRDPSEELEQSIQKQMDNEDEVHGWDFNDDISIEESVQTPIHTSPLSVSHVEKDQIFSRDSSKDIEQSIPKQIDNEDEVHGWDFNDDISIEESVQTPILTSPLSASHVEEDQSFSKDSSKDLKQSIPKQTGNNGKLHGWDFNDNISLEESVQTPILTSSLSVSHVEKDQIFSRDMSKDIEQSIPKQIDNNEKVHGWDFNDNISLEESVQTPILTSSLSVSHVEKDQIFSRDMSKDIEQSIPKQTGNNEIVHGWDFNDNISLEESVQTPILTSPLSASHVEEDQSFSKDSSKDLKQSIPKQTGNNGKLHGWDFNDNISLEESVQTPILTSSLSVSHVEKDQIFSRDMSKDIEQSIPKQIDNNEKVHGWDFNDNISLEESVQTPILTSPLSASHVEEDQSFSRDSSKDLKQSIPKQTGNNEIVHGWDFNDNISLEESVQTPILTSPLSASHVEEDQSFSGDMSKDIEQSNPKQIDNKEELDGWDFNDDISIEESVQTPILTSPLSASHVEEDQSFSRDSSKDLKQSIPKQTGNNEIVHGWHFNDNISSEESVQTPILTSPLSASHVEEDQSFSRDSSKDLKQSIPKQTGNNEIVHGWDFNDNISLEESVQTPILTSSLSVSHVEKDQIFSRDMSKDIEQSIPKQIDNNEKVHGWDFNDNISLEESVQTPILTSPLSTSHVEEDQSFSRDSSKDLKQSIPKQTGNNEIVHGWDFNDNISLEESVQTPILTSPLSTSHVEEDQSFSRDSSKDLKQSIPKQTGNNEIVHGWDFNDNISLEESVQTPILTSSLSVSHVEKDQIFSRDMSKDIEQSIPKQIDNNEKVHGWDFNDNISLEESVQTPILTSPLSTSHVEEDQSFSRDSSKDLKQSIPKQTGNNEIVHGWDFNDNISLEESVQTPILTSPLSTSHVEEDQSFSRDSSKDLKQSIPKQTGNNEIVHGWDFNDNISLEESVQTPILTSPLSASHVEEDQISSRDPSKDIEQSIPKKINNKEELDGWDFNDNISLEESVQTPILTSPLSTSHVEEDQSFSRDSSKDLKQSIPKQTGNNEIVHGWDFNDNISLEESVQTPILTSPLSASHVEEDQSFSGDPSKDIEQSIPKQIDNNEKVHGWDFNDNISLEESVQTPIYTSPLSVSHVEKDQISSRDPSKDIEQSIPKQIDNNEKVHGWDFNDDISIEESVQTPILTSPLSASHVEEDQSFSGDMSKDIEQSNPKQIDNKEELDGWDFNDNISLEESVQTPILTSPLSASHVEEDQSFSRDPSKDIEQSIPKQIDNNEKVHGWDFNDDISIEESVQTPILTSPLSASHVEEDQSFSGDPSKDIEQSIPKQIDNNEKVHGWDFNDNISLEESVQTPIYTSPLSVSHVEKDQISSRDPSKDIEQSIPKKINNKEELDGWDFNDNISLEESVQTPILTSPLSTSHVEEDQSFSRDSSKDLKQSIPKQTGNNEIVHGWDFNDNISLEESVQTPILTSPLSASHVEEDQSFSGDMSKDIEQSNPKQIDNKEELDGWDFNDNISLEESVQTPILTSPLSASHVEEDQSFSRDPSKDIEQSIPKQIDNNEKVHGWDFNDNISLEESVQTPIYTSPLSVSHVEKDQISSRDPSKDIEQSIPKQINNKEELDGWDFNDNISLEESVQTPILTSPLSASHVEKDQIFSRDMSKDIEQSILKQIDNNEKVHGWDFNDDISIEESVQSPIHISNSNVSHAQKDQISSRDMSKDLEQSIPKQIDNMEELDGWDFNDDLSIEESVQTPILTSPLSASHVQEDQSFSRDPSKDLEQSIPKQTGNNKKVHGWDSKDVIEKQYFSPSDVISSDTLDIEDNRNNAHNFSVTAEHSFFKPVQTAETVHPFDSNHSTANFNRPPFQTDFIPFRIFFENKNKALIRNPAQSDPPELSNTVQSSVESYEKDCLNTAMLKPIRNSIDLNVIHNVNFSTTDTTILLPLSFPPHSYNGTDYTRTRDQTQSGTLKDTAIQLNDSDTSSTINLIPCLKVESASYDKSDFDYLNPCQDCIRQSTAMGHHTESYKTEKTFSASTRPLVLRNVYVNNDMISCNDPLSIDEFYKPNFQPSNSYKEPILTSSVEFCSLPIGICQLDKRNDRTKLDTCCSSLIRRHKTDEMTSFTQSDLVSLDPTFESEKSDILQSHSVINIGQHTHQHDEEHHVDALAVVNHSPDIILSDLDSWGEEMVHD